MDMLKYCFVIDPVHKDREQIRRKKQVKKRKAVIQRLVYFDTPPEVPSLGKQISTIKESAV
ncbi:hypothetical protein I4U23_005262 [Adineta vaga]|nr:hypothetical protein I4U23_005262 [Adineta vaga]